MVLAWAIIVHLLAFAAIGISFKSSDPNISAVKKEKVIEAVAVNESKIEEEIKKLRQADKRKERENKRLQNKAQKAKSDRRKEEKKLKALKKKQKEQERINKDKRIKENKRLAALEKKTKAQERQAQKTQDKLNKLEKERQEKKALLEKEENERKAKIAEKKRLVEKQQREKQNNIDVDKYRALIKGKITSKWIIPASYQTGMKCEVLVRLIPSGDVVSVYISKSSGNSSFDRSVEQAVKKSSPLPLPASSKNLFNEFREVRLVFSPNL